MAMASVKVVLNFISYLLFFHVIVTTNSQLILDPLMYLCSSQGNFTTNGTYQSNLLQALTSISSNTQIDYGFYNSSFGQNPDKVYALALCRGDRSLSSCRSCIHNSTQKITQLCPNQKEAFVWYDDCMLRYSNRSIFGNMQFHPSFFMYNINNVSDAVQFNQVVKSLLHNLTAQAASGNSHRKFATGNATISDNNQTIYGLVQCTPDLSRQECRSCLANATSALPECCDGKKGGRVIGTSCQLRYEIELFYDTAPRDMAPSPAPAVEPMVLPPSPQTAPPPPASLSPPPTTGTARVIGEGGKIAGAFIVSVLLLLLL